MKIANEGIVFSGSAGTRTANCCFPSIARFGDGTLLVAWRVGTVKDSADGTIYMSRSKDGGKSWDDPICPFSKPVEGKEGSYGLDGVPGDLHFAAVTALDDNRAMTAMMWLDRSDPGRAMFNEATEGLLRVHTLMAKSDDQGKTWGEPYLFDAAPYEGVAALCAPILKLADGNLACQVETNKPYDDSEVWKQHACLKFSSDEGLTWKDMVSVAHDPTFRIRYWDQRHAVAPDGTMVAGFWIYDAVDHKELGFRIAVSEDCGRTWSVPHECGFDYQLPYPVFLPDGRLVLFCIDRYKTRTIRALVSEDKGRTFLPGELVVYQHPVGRKEPGEDDHQLADQQIWTFGRLEGVSDSAGNVWVVYYAGDNDSTNIHWAQISF
ncbi:MAG: exo-alpha-sialidase [Sedimentisphaerales bacterium]|nr:exo-alpha-sialidase [Sedimentisphaerales bacterium]